MSSNPPQHVSVCSAPTYATAVDLRLHRPDLEGQSLARSVGLAQAAWHATACGGGGSPREPWFPRLHLWCPEFRTARYPGRQGESPGWSAFAAEHCPMPLSMRESISREHFQDSLAYLAVKGGLT